MSLCKKVGKNFAGKGKHWDEGLNFVVQACFGPSSLPMLVKTNNLQLMGILFVFKI